MFAKTFAFESLPLDEKLFRLENLLNLTYMFLYDNFKKENKQNFTITKFPVNIFRYS